ncbi:MAG: alpha-2-macroglobulin family protein [Limnospira sp.]
MRTRGFSRKTWRRYFLLFLFIFTIAGCRIFSGQPGGESLPTISALPTPQLPEWIEDINPTEEAASLSPVRVIFKDPLIPVERLDSPNQRQQLKYFDITPDIPGEFRFLTPRMVGFQAEETIPRATRFRVTLKKGLGDLNNHKLEADVSWTFQTPAIALSNLPGTEENPGTKEDPVGLEPTLKFTSNVELDPASLKEHVQLISDKTKQTVPLTVALVEDEADGEEVSGRTEVEPSSHMWDYSIKPDKKLEKGARYNLEITPGLRSRRGNLQSQFIISNPIYTYEPLQFQALQFYGKPGEGVSYGRFTNGSPQLKFNNGIIAESAVENIGITPAPPEDAPPLVQAYDGSDTVSLNAWALEPNTNYSIAIGGNLKDKFDQTLEKPVTLNYKTGDLAANLWTPSGLNIFPSSENLQLNISTVNLPDAKYRAAYQIVQPEDLVYSNNANLRNQGKNLLPPKQRWTSFSVANPKNETQETPINLREKLGGETGLLAYGITARTTSYQKNGTTQWNEPEYYGLVELTNLGVFAQWFPESGLVRVNHLDDGSAAESASVEIYKSQLEATTFPDPEPCASGTTDENGLLRLNGEQLRGCMDGNRFEKGPQLLAIAKEGNDWAFTRTFSYSGSYGYGIYANWENNQPISRGTIFSDRQLYQPGEPVALTGVASYLQNGELKLDKNIPYTLTLETPSGEKRQLGEYQTNEFGTFSVELDLRPDDPLGNYAIAAKSNGGVEIAGNFRVAEFNPPNFKVDLNLDREFAVPGDTLTATAKSDYLFGAPVVGGEAEYYVTRTATDFTPQGWDKYSFGRQWFWPEEKPAVPSDVLQRSRQLDDSGTATETVTISDDLPYPMRYRVDVDVKDVSNLSVANSKSVVALPGDRLIGLKTKFVAEANQAFPVDVIVTDINGKSLDNIPLKLQLQKMNYSSITRVVEGGQSDRNQIEYETVATLDVRSENTAKTVELTAPESGSYRIQATFADEKNDSPNATDIQIWVTGDEAVRWGNRYDNRLEIQLDRDTYQPGDTATALIQSPYEEGELFFAVIRDRTFYETLIPVKGGAPEIRFQVTPEMLPNVAVEAVLVRQGKSLSEIEPGSLDNLVSIGMTPLQVDKAKKYLQVNVNPTQPDIQPGSEETLKLTLFDSQNKPIRGQITLMVVNDAILQLNGYRPPNLVDTVYAEQSISTNFSDNRPDVQLEQRTSALEKGWGYGGGLSAGTAATSVRQDFKPLAYYDGSIVTDNDGKAEVTLTLPDNLTTWRVMAVASDGNLNFGSGEATFITTKPLLSNPILPQFARVGDRFLAGVSVTNRENAEGRLNITGNVDGGIRFTAGNNTSHNLKTKAEPDTQAYRFPVVVEDTETAEIQFTTQLQNLGDSFQVPLEIKPLEVSESAIASGIATEAITIPVNVDKEVIPNAGGLNISLASTLIPQLTEPAKQIFEREYYPFLEPAASQLLIASNLRILGEKYNNLEDLNLESRGNDAIATLKTLQGEDGGFRYFPDAKTSDPVLSSYAAEALATAKIAGFEVDNNRIERLKTYLNQVIADPSQNDFCGDNICKNRLRLNALMALSALGETRGDFMAEIYGIREQFDPVTQIELARYLANFPEWQQEFNTLFDEIQEIIYQTGRTATVNLPNGYQWLDSPATVQSQALRLFIAQNQQPETVGKLVQSLLNLRREGTWRNRYETAEALTALVAYAETEPTPENLRVAITLGNQNLGSTQFESDRNTSFNLDIPMEELPKGDNQLVIQPSGSGQLNYWVEYGYRLEGNQPGRLNGLRVIRTVRPANDSEILYTSGLSAESKPLEVKPGQVFDIGLEIIADRPVDRVIITDPLPAGFEAVDASFQTSNRAQTAQSDSWEIGYQTIYRDRIFAYGDRLEPGAYQLHYLVRSVTPGEFIWPGAKAELQYAPEEFGRTASGLLVVSDR